MPWKPDNNEEWLKLPVGYLIETKVRVTKFEAKSGLQLIYYWNPGT
jgi:hypothetical protein